MTAQGGKLPWSRARRAVSAGLRLLLSPPHGARVLVGGRDEQRAKDVVAEIEGSTGSAMFRLTTLGDLESARELVEWATEAGSGHVDILIDDAHRS